jgi:hypothetical protein
MGRHWAEVLWVYGARRIWEVPGRWRARDSAKAIPWQHQDSHRACRAYARWRLNDARPPESLPRVDPGAMDPGVIRIAAKARRRDRQAGAAGHRRPGGSSGVGRPSRFRKGCCGQAAWWVARVAANGISRDPTTAAASSVAAAPTATATATVVLVCRRLPGILACGLTA